MPGKSIHHNLLSVDDFAVSGLVHGCTGYWPVWYDVIIAGYIYH